MSSKTPMEVLELMGVPLSSREIQHILKRLANVSYSHAQIAKEMKNVEFKVCGPDNKLRYFTSQSKESRQSEVDLLTISDFSFYKEQEMLLKDIQAPSVQKTRISIAEENDDLPVDFDGFLTNVENKDPTDNIELQTIGDTLFYKTTITNGDETFPILQTVDGGFCNARLLMEAAAVQQRDQSLLSYYHDCRGLRVVEDSVLNGTWISLEGARKLSNSLCLYELHHFLSGKLTPETFQKKPKRSSRRR